MDSTVAATLDHTHVREGIARPIGKLYEAESLVGIVPFDHGLDRGTGDPVIGQVEGRPRGDGKRSTQVCT
jgi:hypothetical protein